MGVAQDTQLEQICAEVTLADTLGGGGGEGYLISGPERGGLIREGGLRERGGGLFQITYFR